mmetsp:Transcript_41315/g.86528  ORF Transcript_41315/g.86528 Transcript_41315/m.86528 type:complete len:210 (-) Transcript_41315:382-1011(-)
MFAVARSVALFSYVRSQLTHRVAREPPWLRRLSTPISCAALRLKISAVSMAPARQTTCSTGMVKWKTVWFKRGASSLAYACNQTRPPIACAAWFTVARPTSSLHAGTLSTACMHSSALSNGTSAPLTESISTRSMRPAPSAPSSICIEMVICASRLPKRRALLSASLSASVNILSSTQHVTAAQPRTTTSKPAIFFTRASTSQTVRSER